MSKFIIIDCEINKLQSNKELYNTINRRILYYLVKHNIKEFYISQIQDNLGKILTIHNYFFSPYYLSDRADKIGTIQSYKGTYIDVLIDKNITRSNVIFFKKGLKIFRYEKMKHILNIISEDNYLGIIVKNI